MRCPNAFIDKKINSNDDRLRIINENNDIKKAFGVRFEPTNFDEGMNFHKSSAQAYELYIICSTDNIIEEINHRIEPCPCSQHSFTPNNVPLHIFPDGAMFDIDWNDINIICRRKIVKLLASTTKLKLKDNNK